VELQNRLWQQAVAVTAAAPQSLPAYRFVASLNEMNNIHASRLTPLRYRVPGAVMFLLVLVARSDPDASAAPDRRAIRNSAIAANTASSPRGSGQAELFVPRARRGCGLGWSGSTWPT
jgi:hypothetical protein